MNAYVVAPSCNEAGTQNLWLPKIEKYHVAVTGWANDETDGEKRLGHRFASIHEGDLVIIANGKNASKTCYFAGFASGTDDRDLAKQIDATQARKLSSFTSLEGEKIPFSDACKFGNTPGPWIDACYTLDIDGNDADRKVVQAVLSIIVKKQGEKMIAKYCETLSSVKNLIFTGAPGTGKTYLARQIAQCLTIGRVVDDAHPATPEEKVRMNEQIGFVQFHPSFDYTDFIEGLRPVKSEHEIGFERRDGIFMGFCRNAVKGGRLLTRVDNFDVSWDRLVHKLQTSPEHRVKVDNMSGRGEFPIELNVYGTGLASRTYDGEGDWERGKSKFFSKEQLYRVYKGENGVPSGGHDTYRRAIIKYMKKECGLQDYAEDLIADGNASTRNYVFIIDEINRGDVSKIFGELFYSIDPGYRGPSGAIQTRFCNLNEDDAEFPDGQFYVPDNVYIIGTMNDIDRSVESMDFAIRRRFTWIEVKADEERLRTMWGVDDPVSSVKVEDILSRYNALNMVIGKATADGLGKAFMVGPSYFLKLKEMRGVDAAQAFRMLWTHHIEPLLREYVRGLPNGDELLHKFEDAYFLRTLQTADGDTQE